MTIPYTSCVRYGELKTGYLASGIFLTLVFKTCTERILATFNSNKKGKSNICQNEQNENEQFARKKLSTHHSNPRDFPTHPPPTAIPASSFC